MSGEALLSGGDSLSLREKADVPQIETEKACEPPVIYVPKSDFDRLTPERILSLEQEHKVRFVPFDPVHGVKTPEYLKEDLSQTDLSVLMDKSKNIDALMPSIIDNGHRKSGKTPRIEPRNAKKKRKAKRRQQKQSRRKR